MIGSAPKVPIPSRPPASPGMNSKVKLGGCGISMLSMDVDPLVSTENIFGERQRSASSITPEQALIHLIKGKPNNGAPTLLPYLVMMGTGMLSLPLAFKYSGLWVCHRERRPHWKVLSFQLGMVLLVIICVVCTYCCRQLVHASQYLCRK